MARIVDSQLYAMRVLIAATQLLTTLNLVIRSAQAVLTRLFTKRLFTKRLFTKRQTNRPIALLWLTLLLNALPAFATEERPTALIFTAPGEVFKEIVTGITGDLEDELNFVIYEISKETQVQQLAAQINQTHPNIIILVENNALNLYSKYQQAHPQLAFPPAIAVAALFVDQFLDKIKNITGIRYEIAAVTSIVNMRSILIEKIETVAVIHREWMLPLIKQNAAFCQAEGIKLISYQLPNKGSKMNIKLKGVLNQLLNDKVDALWVINDNGLLNPKLISSAWLPILADAKIPVIVGIKPLLTSRINFGSFAVVPDHYALGVQTAAIIADIMEANWQLGDRQIEQLVSVKKLVNTAILDHKKIKYHKALLENMDEIVK